MAEAVPSAQSNQKQKSPKVYVQVKVDFREDGVTYEIDRVLQITQAAAMRAGGQGDRYKIRVRGKESYLFFERSANLTGNNIGRWFVERRT